MSNRDPKFDDQPKSWDMLVRPGSLHAVRIGTSTVAIGLVCTLALGLFSVVDYREVAYQDRENALVQTEARQAKEQKEFMAWLETKEKDFDQYLWLAGEVEKPTADTEKSPVLRGHSFADLQDRIQRIESQMQVLSSIQETDEDYFWFVPSVAPVALEEEFVLATGPLTRKVVHRGISGLSSKHGVRDHPVTGKREMHYGLDIFCPDGSGVRATANGTVMFVGRYNADQDNLRHSFGNFLVIQHGDSGFRTLYAHLDKVTVSKRQVVRRGDKIGLSGNTGSSTGPHVHYEVVRNGVRVNPLNYITDVPLVEGGRKVYYVKKGKKSSSKGIRLAQRGRRS